MTTLRPLVARGLAAATVTVVLATQSAANAQEPNLVSAGNRWTITAYNDESPIHEEWATQGICFQSIGMFGTHQRYEWWSDTFPDWNGIASQEGNEIVMHGDYAEDVGHDGIKWDLVTSSSKNIGAGHWVEWRENGKLGNTIGFAKALLTRVGRCTISRDQAIQLPLPLDRTGRLMESPFGNVTEQPPAK